MLITLSKWVSPSPFSTLLVAVSTRFQDFYKKGEREKLLAEISALREQVLGDSFFGYCFLLRALR